MSFKIQYMTALVYCTSNKIPNDKAKKRSHGICDKFKAGDKRYIDRLGQHIMSNPRYATIKTNFENATLIPIPRSAPLKPQAIWPAKIIAEQFIEMGLGIEIIELLKRRTVVPKSRNFRLAADRPSIDTLYDSLQVDRTMLNAKKIILIDDVFTLGRTAVSCVKRLKDIYPDIEIQVFSAMRTRGGLSSFSDIHDPKVDVLFYKGGDKVILPD